jgi:hypothetical protein
MRGFGVRVLGASGRYRYDTPLFCITLSIRVLGIGVVMI